MKELHVIGPKDKAPVPGPLVNTTSRSKDFGLAFSPFLSQGILQHGNLRAENVENFWQFTKVYKQHLGKSDEWKIWRDRGLADKFAHRYPMGKGARAEFAWFNGKKLDYIEAREAIYVPVYEQKLQRFCQRQVQSLMDMLTVTDVWLWDFDGYKTDKSFKEVLDDSSKSMGHAFVIKRFVYNKLGVEW
jgi:hypothetical protein